MSGCSCGAGAALPGKHASACPVNTWHNPAPKRYVLALIELPDPDNGAACGSCSLPGTVVATTPAHMIDAGEVWQIISDLLRSWRAL